MSPMQLNKTKKQTIEQHMDSMDSKSSI